MPLFTAIDALSGTGADADGRQSPAALKVRRGAARLMRDCGYAVMPELTLPSGRRADLVGVSGEGALWIVEVKSSRADFLADSKWPSYAAFCDHFSFAAPPELSEIFPADEGLILSDGYDGEIVRPAREHRLGAKPRRAMHLLIALASARRLHERDDPSLNLSVPT